VPELPEVELTRRRLERDLVGREIEGIEVRTPKLRLPIPSDLKAVLPGRTVRAVERRGKYLLFDCESGWLIVHLGMTGFLHFFPEQLLPGKHDHLDIVFTGGGVLRLHDPRKFGTFLWTSENPADHPLLARIGPEPLVSGFDGDYLFRASRQRRIAVKLLVMDQTVVAGVGNIYANEALFRAGIRPDRPSSSLSHSDCILLVAAVREVLQESINLGSTFRIAEETASYHPLEFDVYGRGKGNCSRCSGALEEIRLGNRSTVFCPRCQV
jgi:formamidopyrimidine-DNA glycosylase